VLVVLYAVQEHVQGEHELREHVHRDEPDVLRNGW